MQRYRVYMHLWVTTYMWCKIALRTWFIMSELGRKRKGVVIQGKYC